MSSTEATAGGRVVGGSGRARAADAGPDHGGCGRACPCSSEESAVDWRCRSCPSRTQTTTVGSVTTASSSDGSTWAEPSQLLAFSLQIGLVATACYLVARHLVIGPRWFQVTSMAVGAGTVVVAALLVDPEGIDFTAFDPPLLPIVLFIAIPIVVRRLPGRGRGTPDPFGLVRSRPTCGGHRADRPRALGDRRSES